MSSNSPLVNYVAISPFRTSPRRKPIDMIIIHCMAGNFSVETCGNIFQRTGRNASSNYGIGSDGRIAMYVEEKDRAWCSGGKDKNGRVIRVNGYSGADIDHRAISIEVANDGGAPDWHVSDKAMQSLILLCVDICRRNGIKKLLWKADKNLVGKIEQQNMAAHRWFANKACPGNFLYENEGYIASEANKILGVEEKPLNEENTKPQTYIVKKGDTLSKIAKANGITLATLLRINPEITNANKIYVGQKIRIK